MDNPQTVARGNKRRSLFWLSRPTKAQRKRLLLMEAWALVLIALALLVFAYLWPPDWRNQHTVFVWTAWIAFMIRTFLFHAGLVLVLVVVVAIWAREWRLVLATLPVLAVTVGPTCWQFRPRRVPSPSAQTMTVMSVNLLFLNREMEEVVAEIKSAAPDVLLLQEYTHHWHDALQTALGPDYPFRAYERREDSFGAAIYSRLPFEEPVAMDVSLGEAYEPQIRAVVGLGTRKVAVYNVHLLPPWGLDYIRENRSQMADLLDVLAKEVLPVVLGGDFNFAERSPHAAALRAIGLRDAFDEAGWGRGATWPVHSFFRWIPSIRLDHIYLRDGLTAIRCRTGVACGSDHRPVIAEVGLASEKAAPGR